MFRHPVSNPMADDPSPRVDVGGRPRSTSRDELAAVALSLFVEHGFEATTLSDIAATAGVSRRTVLRYFSSKNDIVWGAFDERLRELRTRLAEAPAEAEILDVVAEAVVAFNDYGEAVLPELRERMTLITTVPALQGHAMLRYAEWCAVIAEFVAQRLDTEPFDHVPHVTANAALGVAMATYRFWISNPDSDLLARMREGFAVLQRA
jgi:mycofactocin system transcriptional regulator